MDDIFLNEISKTQIIVEETAIFNKKRGEIRNQQLPRLIILFIVLLLPIYVIVKSMKIEDSVGAAIGLFCGMGFIGFYFNIVHIKNIESEELEKNINNRIANETKRIKIKNYTLKNEIPNKYNVIKYVKGLHTIDSETNNNAIDFIVWVDENSLYLVDNNIDQSVEKICFSINSIISFSREGDFFTSTEITGGNISGGGSSIGGAIVGGILAGGVGAIINSRQGIKSKPIKSITTEVDKRKTILEIELDNKIEYIFFSSDSFDVFLQLIPNKDIRYRNNIYQIDKKNEDNENTIVFEKLKKLAELKEKNIISDNEFNEKKKELLSKI